MKAQVEVLVEVPDDLPVKRHDDFGPLKVVQVTKPHPKNVESGIVPIGVTVEAARSFDASSTMEVLEQLAQHLRAQPWLEPDALIEISIQTTTIERR